MFDCGALAASRPKNANGGQADAAAARLLACKGACTAADYAPASPVTYIDAKDPPFLLIHGDDDQTVSVALSHIVEARLKAAGLPVEAIYIPDVDHSFIGKTAETTRAATLRATDATFEFFHKVLNGKAR